MTLLKDTTGDSGFAFNTHVVKGGLDQGTTAAQRRGISHLVTVEQRASVQAYDLAGNALRVYTNPQGSSHTENTNPLTADTNGRIAGFVEAPDFDLYVTPTSGGAYTQRIRTSPPGVFHANSYGAKPYSNNNAIGTVESQAAINAAYAAADTEYGWGAQVEVAPGAYLIGGSITPVDNVGMRGSGGLASRLYLKAGVNVPIFDSLPLGAGGRYDIEGVGFRCQTVASHTLTGVTGVNSTDTFTKSAHGLANGTPVQLASLTGGSGLSIWLTYYVISTATNTFQVALTAGGSAVDFGSDVSTVTVKPIFPLVRAQVYASTFRDLFIDSFPGDGFMLTSGGSFAADTNTIQDVTIAGINGTSRFGFYFNDASAFHVYGGLTVSVGVGCYVRCTGAQGLFNGTIQGYHFEEIDRYAVYLDGAQNINISENYVFSCPIGINKNSHHNRVQNNTLISSSVYASGGQMIYDGGRDNITTPNKGQPRLPLEGRPLDRLRPASIFKDSDLSFRGTGGWTATGGATLEKKDNYGPTVRHFDRIGRLPLAILGAAGKGAQLATSSNLVAGTDYAFEPAWWVGLPGPPQIRFKLVDPAGPTTLYDSGNVTHNVTSGTEWVDDLIRVVFAIPAGPPDIRFEVSTPDAGPIYVGNVDFIRSLLVNGGFVGAYASGVAPSWSNLAGAGTPSEENVLYAQAQKLSVAATQSLTLGQAVTVDEDTFYLVRGKIQVVTGGAGRARVGWGNADLNSTSDAQITSIASARFAGVEEAVTSVFRPSTFTRLLIGLSSDASVAASAVFKDFAMFPLKEVEGPQTYVSDEIDLTAASKNYLIPVPQRMDLRLRRVHFVYSVAATAVGPTIRVGNPTSSNYFCNLGPGANPQAVGDVLRQAGSPTSAPSRTDIRVGAPIIVTHSGLVANAGKGHVIVECE